METEVRVSIYDLVLANQITIVRYRAGQTIIAILWALEFFTLGSRSSAPVLFSKKFSSEEYAFGGHDTDESGIFKMTPKGPIERAIFR